MNTTLTHAHAGLWGRSNTCMPVSVPVSAPVPVSLLVPVFVCRIPHTTKCRLFTAATNTTIVNNYRIIINAVINAH